MHGPTYIFRANLTPFSRKLYAREKERKDKEKLTAITKGCADLRLIKVTT
jgi:hypothetical protein